MKGGVKVGSKDIDSIIVTTEVDEVIAVISDTEIIAKDGYRVILEPAKDSN